MPSPYNLKRLAAMEPQIAADLRKLYRQPFSEAALDGALPPTRTTSPTEHHRALSLPLVRIHVEMDWQSLWLSCPDNKDGIGESSRDEWERKIGDFADRTAKWLCREHLPFAQDEVVDIAVSVKRELWDHIDASEAGTHIPTLAEETACPAPAASILVRREPVRSAVLAEVQRRRENKEKQRTPDSHRDGMEESALLKRALAPYLDPMLDGNVTRRVWRIGREETRHEAVARELIEKAQALIGAEWVPVEQSRRPFEIAPLAFLKSAHEWAVSTRKHPPACEAVGSTHVAKRARDCAKILAFLGELHRRSKAGEGDGFASLNDIARDVRGVSGGTIYLRIAELTEGLIGLGFATDSGEKTAAGRRIAIAAEVGDLRVWRAVYSSQSVLKKAK